MLHDAQTATKSCSAAKCRHVPPDYKGAILAPGGVRCGEIGIVFGLRHADRKRALSVCLSAPLQ
jgi:hypothetical protein